MKTRTVCFLLDVGVKEARNGKSYIQLLRDALLPTVSKLEPGDCLILYENGDISAYEELGQFISAVNSYKPHKFVISTALREVVELVHAISVDEDVYFFVVTDNYRQNYSYGCRRLLEREPNLNIYNKESHFHFFAVGEGFNEMLQLEGAHDNLTLRCIDDMSDVTSEDFIRPLHMV